MIFFPWSSKYELGHDLIDSQHKQFVHLLNEAYTGLATAEDEATLNKLMTALTDYCEKHFKDEEALMRSLKYPRYETYQFTHEKLKERIAQLVEHHEGDPHEIMTHLAPFMKKWLQSHILEADVEIVKFSKQDKLKFRP